MKTTSTLLAVTFLASIANASFIVNGDFEDGLNGWEIDASGGGFYKSGSGLTEYPFLHPILDDAIDLKFGDVFIEPGLFTTSESTLSDDSGQMLEIFNRYVGTSHNFNDINGETWGYLFEFYTLELQQSLDLTAGQTVSGWSRFSTEEEFYEIWDYDNAAVAIDGVDIWENSVRDVLEGKRTTIQGPYGPEFLIEPSEWEQWSWTAPVDGTYELSLKAAGDDQDASWAYFDNITVSSPTTRVDDSFSTLALLSSAMGLLLFLRRSIKQRKYGLAA